MFATKSYEMEIGFSAISVDELYYVNGGCGNNSGNSGSNSGNSGTQSGNSGCSGNNVASNNGSNNKVTINFFIKISIF